MATPDALDAAQHMDGIYRTQRHIYDATRKYYLLGRDRLIDGLDAPDGGRVLEVACGTGRNLIAAARRYPRSSFYGLDISREMLATAEAAIARARLTDRIVVAEADAAEFSPAALFNVPDFDRVFISYAVSMIPPWRQALSTAMLATAPQGQLHVVDFGQQRGLPRWFHRGLAAWLATFSVTPRPDLEAELRSVSTATGATLEFASLYRDYARYGIIRRQG